MRENSKCDYNQNKETIALRRNYLPFTIDIDSRFEYISSAERIQEENMSFLQPNFSYPQ